jgi:protein-disulfide isomerase
MCAAAQSRFWDVHDRLFASQEEWSLSPDPVSRFRQLVSDAGVDTVAWNQCLLDDVMVPLIDADRARGQVSGVDQTPYFFVGSQKVGGVISAKILRPMLDSAIALAGGATR